jgi:5-methyltetrahydropteroyltriglutamate--homocysteine methyltransferase
VALEPVERHPWPADVSFDGGDLDGGNGLLLLICEHLDPLVPGQLLEFRSIEISVDEDFAAWCRLTGNESGCRSRSAGASGTSSSARGR